MASHQGCHWRVAIVCWIWSFAMTSSTEAAITLTSSVTSLSVNSTAAFDGVNVGNYLTFSDSNGGGGASCEYNIDAELQTSVAGYLDALNTLSLSNSSVEANVTTGSSSSRMNPLSFVGNYSSVVSALQVLLAHPVDGESTLFVNASDFNCGGSTIVSANISFSVTLLSSGLAVHVVSGSTLEENSQKALQVDFTDEYGSTSKYYNCNYTVELNVTTGLTFASTNTAVYSFTQSYDEVVSTLNALSITSGAGVNSAANSHFLNATVSMPADCGRGPYNTSAELLLDVKPVNDAINVTATTATLQMHKKDGAQQLSFVLSDEDEGAEYGGCNYTVYIEASSILTVTVGTTSGIGFVVGDGVADQSIEFSGSYSDVKVAVSSLQVDNVGELYDASGTQTVTVNATDNGCGSESRASPSHSLATMNITVLDENRAPVISWAPLSTTEEPSETAFLVSNLQVTDSDVNDNTCTYNVSLSINSGTMYLPNATLLSYADGTVSSGNYTVFTGAGTLSSVASLVSSVYANIPSNVNILSGNISLYVSVDDNGCPGNYSALSSSATVNITVERANSAISVSSTDSSYSINETAAAFATPVSITDVDALENSCNYTLEVTPSSFASVSLNLTDYSGLSFTSGTGTGGDSYINATGYWSVIEAAVGSVVVTPISGMNDNTGGPHWVAVSVNDNGCGGATPGAYADLVNLTVSVTPINDAVVVNGSDISRPKSEQTALSLYDYISLSDVDGGEVSCNYTIQWSLWTPDGGLSLATTTDTSAVSVSADSSATSGSFTGPYTDVVAAMTNATLNSAAYYTVENGSLYVHFADNGCSGLGSATEGSVNISITYDSVNLPPSWTDFSSTVPEDTVFVDLSGLDVLDPENDTSCNYTLSIASSLNATFDITAWDSASTSVYVVSGTGANDSSVEVYGSYTTLKGYVQSIRLYPAPNTNDNGGDLLLTLFLNDTTCSGTVAADRTNGIANVSLTSVNDPVTFSHVNYTIDEDTVLQLAGFNITDVDGLESSCEYSVSLSATSGASLTLASTSSLAFSVGDGASDADMSFRGSFDAVQTAITGMTLTPESHRHDMYGVILVNANVSDNNCAAQSGTESSDSVMFEVSVTAVNDEVYVSDSTYSTVEDSSAVSTSITVTDVDGYETNCTYSVSLSVNRNASVAFVGALYESALSISTTSANEQTSVAMEGPFYAVEDILTRVQVTPQENSNDNLGAVEIAVNVTDNMCGATKIQVWSGVNTTTLNVSPVNDAITLTSPGNFTLDEDASNVHLWPLTMTDVDGLEGSCNYDVFMSVTNGAQLSTNYTTNITFGGGSAGTGHSFLEMSGPFSDILSAMENTHLTLGADINNVTGDVVLMFNVTDNLCGGSASGGVESNATATFYVNVIPVNDPVQFIYSNITIDEDTQGYNLSALNVTDVDALEGECDYHVRLSTDMNSTMQMWYTTNLTFSVGGNSQSSRGEAEFDFTGLWTHVEAAVRSVTLYLEDNRNDINGVITLQMFVEDFGCNGVGSATSDSVNMTINVTPVNDQPVLTASNVSVRTDEDPTNFTIPSMSVTDVDQYEVYDNYTVTVSSFNGYVSLNPESRDVVTWINGNGTWDTQFAFRATHAQTNVALTNLAYSFREEHYNEELNRLEYVTVIVSDSGNWGTGGALEDSAQVNISLSFVNDAPVLSCPNQTAVEDQWSTLSLDVTDVDAAEGSDNMYVTLSSSFGSFNLPTVSGLTFHVGNGTNDTSVEFNGTIANVRSALASLEYKALVENYNNYDTINITARDLGAGSGIDILVQDTCPLSYVWVNNEPHLFLETRYDSNGVALADQHLLELTEDTLHQVPGLNVTDVDLVDIYGYGNISMNLTCSGGVMSIGDKSGLTFFWGTGTSDKSMNFTGDYLDIVRALYDVSYTPDQHYDQNDTIWYTVDDLQSHGISHSLSDTFYFNVTLGDRNDAPTIEKTQNYAAPGAKTPIGPITISDVDAYGQAIELTLAVSNGTITLALLTDTEIAAVGGDVEYLHVNTSLGEDGTVGNQIILRGTLDQLNARLQGGPSGIQYRSTHESTGSDSLNVTANDYGFTGVGAVGITYKYVTLDTDCQQADPPQIHNITFSSDGSSLLVNFYPRTDRPFETTSSNVFLCSNVLESASQTLVGTDATCSWLTLQQLQIQFGTGATAVPGSTLYFTDNKIRNCDTATTYGTNMNATILAMSNPPVPTALLDAPEVLGKCDGLSMGAENSLNNVGRPFKFEWSVDAAPSSGTYDYSTDPWNITGLNTILQAASQDCTATGSGSSCESSSQRINFVESDLYRGGRFQFNVSLSNFLGEGANGTVIVEKKDILVPLMVVLNQPKDITGLKSDEIRILAQAEAPTFGCDPADGTIADFSMNFTWSCSDASSSALDLTHSGVAGSNGQTLILSPSFLRTLVSDSTHSCKVVGSMISDPSRTSFATATFTVSSSPLEAVIVSGRTSDALFVASSVVAKRDADFILDGTQTIDPDAATGLINTTAATISWSCTTPFCWQNGQFVFCGGTYACFDRNQALLSLSPSDRPVIAAETLLAGTYYFKMDVSQDSRTTTATLSAKFVNGDPPVLQIQRVVNGQNSTAAKINPTDSLALRAFSTKFVVTSWSGNSDVDYSPIDLAAQYTAGTLRTPYFSDEYKREVSLVLGRGLMEEKKSYKFVLSACVLPLSQCPEENLGTSEVVITINEPPVCTANCLATSFSGDTLFPYNTSVTLTAGSFIDSDSPLLFTFGYITEDGTRQAMAIDTPAKIFTISPGIPHSSTGIITMFVRAKDSFGAVSDYKDLNLTMSTTYNATLAQDTMDTDRQNAMATKDVKKLMTIISALTVFNETGGDEGNSTTSVDIDQVHKNAADSLLWLLEEVAVAEGSVADIFKILRTLLSKSSSTARDNFRTVVESAVDRLITGASSGGLTLEDSQVMLEMVEFLAKEPSSNNGTFDYGSAYAEEYARSNNKTVDILNSLSKLAMTQLSAGESSATVSGSRFDVHVSRVFVEDIQTGAGSMGFDNLTLPSGVLGTNDPGSDVKFMVNRHKFGNNPYGASNASFAVAAATYDIVLRDSDGNNLDISGLSEGIEFSFQYECDFDYESIRQNQPPATYARACTWYQEGATETSGEWLNTGCTIVSDTELTCPTNSTTCTNCTITCSCNHLTTFTTSYEESIPEANIISPIPTLSFENVAAIIVLFLLILCWLLCIYVGWRWDRRDEQQKIREEWRIRRQIHLAKIVEEVEQELVRQQAECDSDGGDPNMPSASGQKINDVFVDEDGEELPRPKLVFYNKFEDGDGTGELKSTTQGRRVNLGAGEGEQDVNLFTLQKMERSKLKLTKNVAAKGRENEGSNVPGSASQPDVVENINAKPKKKKIRNPCVRLFVRMGEAIWLSLRAKHPYLGIIFPEDDGSGLSRPQRITCIFCVILGTIFCTALFFGNDPENINQRVLIGVITGIIMLPAEVSIVFSFKRAQMYKKKIMDERAQMVNSENEWIGVKPKMTRSMRVSNRRQVCLLTTAYIIAFVYSVLCGYYIILYGFYFAPDVNDAWLESSFYALMQESLLQDPMKVVSSLIFGMFMSRLRDMFVPANLTEVVNL